MSAVVAVVLRERFDRPKSSDYVNTKLISQKVNIVAAIFSLVTKPKYWGKPNMDNYDVAFKELERVSKITAKDISFFGDRMF